MDTNGKSQSYNWEALRHFVRDGKAENVSKLRSRYDDLKTLRAEMFHHLPLIEDEMVGTLRAISELTGEEFVHPFKQEPSPEKLDVPRSGRATVEDIKGCKTQRRAMYIIGEINDGIVELNSAVDLIMAARMNKGTRKSSLSTLHHFMSTSDDFEWIAPSKFRLTLGKEAELTTGDEMVFAESLENAA